MFSNSLYGVPDHPKNMQELVPVQSNIAYILGITAGRANKAKPLLHFGATWPEVTRVWGVQPQQAIFYGFTP